ncbi:uncharacterized protein SCHCODRAFT_02500333 [Schizophyllum commune H4-8]|uniref:uncharacterized protein n=1 Tax=Schizophyllum commune (strain H4-8 / FGSC 9210) TaxID=578458 RepID=UPI00215E51ED|nr:uncharacterized protein SCHCODRAFT_02500333 [Schizophyllum commune H4-8]KAI5893793.1 hypothetical protein SCHCODRAFT_02500333 [Schizophyllum commune H4-8]
MPIQASAVPCERVFSSSKETDTTRRANLEPNLMEALQILKFYLHEENLNTILRDPVRNATEAECDLGLPTDVSPADSKEELVEISDSDSTEEEGSCDEHDLDIIANVSH